jgi:hypothetical protein
MDVILAYLHRIDLDVVVRCHLAKYLGYSLLDISSQYPLAVLGRPHQMVLAIVDCMARTLDCHASSGFIPGQWPGMNPPIFVNSVSALLWMLRSPCQASSTGPDEPTTLRDRYCTTASDMEQAPAFAPNTRGLRIAHLDAFRPAYQGSTEHLLPNVQRG